MKTFDAETSRIITATVKSILSLAKTKRELRQFYDDNQAVIDRLRDDDKAQLRKAWADLKDTLQ